MVACVVAVVAVAAVAETAFAAVQILLAAVKYPAALSPGLVASC